MPPTAAVEVGLKRVLVATDFSPSSQKAMHYALALARAHGSKVYLAHVVSSLGFTIAEGDVMCMAQDVAARDMSGLEEEWARRGEFAGIAHESVVCCGVVWEQLRQIVDCEHIDLLVMGTHGRTGLRKIVMGSVAEEVFRHAKYPVMTVGPSVSDTCAVSGRFQHILFPSNFKETSRNALLYAVELANQEHAQLTLLHVISPMPVDETGIGWYVGSDLNLRREQARSTALEQMKAMLALAPALLEKPELAVEFGFTAEEIMVTAAKRSADLILMGVRAGRADASHAPWSIAHQVVHEAHCPVLTVRH